MNRKLVTTLAQVDTHAAIGRLKSPLQCDCHVYFQKWVGWRGALGAGRVVMSASKPLVKRCPLQ